MSPLAILAGQISYSEVLLLQLLLLLFTYFSKYMKQAEEILL
jgi:hypothetical protein